MAGVGGCNVAPWEAARRSNAASGSSALLCSAPEAKRGGPPSGPVVELLALPVSPEGGVSSSSFPCIFLVVAGPVPIHSGGDRSTLSREMLYFTPDPRSMVTALEEGSCEL